MQLKAQKFTLHTRTKKPLLSGADVVQMWCRCGADKLFLVQISHHPAPANPHPERIYKKVCNTFCITYFFLDLHPERLCSRLYTLSGADVVQIMFSLVNKAIKK